MSDPSPRPQVLEARIHMQQPSQNLPRITSISNMDDSDDTNSQDKSTDFHAYQNILLSEPQKVRKAKKKIETPDTLLYKSGRDSI